MLVPVVPAPAEVIQVQRVKALNARLCVNVTAIGGFDPVASVSQPPIRVRDERQHHQKSHDKQ
jgi:hypothetical protein